MCAFDRKTRGRRGRWFYRNIYTFTRPDMNTPPTHTIYRGASTLKSRVGVPTLEYGSANKKRLILASLRFLLGCHLQSTLSIGYCIGFSVDFTTKPFFSAQFSGRPPKSEHYVLLIGHFLIGGPILYCRSCSIFYSFTDHWITYALDLMRFSSPVHGPYTFGTGLARYGPPRLSTRH